MLMPWAVGWMLVRALAMAIMRAVAPSVLHLAHVLLMVRAAAEPEQGRGDDAQREMFHGRASSGRCSSASASARV